MVATQRGKWLGSWKAIQHQDPGSREVVTVTGTNGFCAWNIDASDEVTRKPPETSLIAVPIYGQVARGKLWSFGMVCGIEFAVSENV